MPGLTLLSRNYFMTPTTLSNGTRKRGKKVRRSLSFQFIANIRTGITVPVIPGIMPIQTFGSFARVSRLCGTRVPSVVADALSKISVSLLFE